MTSSTEIKYCVRLSRALPAASYSDILTSFKINCGRSEFGCSESNKNHSLGFEDEITFMNDIVIELLVCRGLFRDRERL
jgi:hypothetical protein